MERGTANHAKLTKISITGFAKLPPASKAQVKWELILLPQPASILNSIKRILFAVVCNKAVVVSEITGVLAILLIMLNTSNKYREAIPIFSKVHSALLNLSKV